MKKIILTTLFFLIIILLVPFKTNGQSNINLLIYYGQGCSHCAVIDSYITNHNLDGQFNIIRKEVYKNKQNAQELTNLFIKMNVPSSQQGVPFVLINGQYYVGDQEIIYALENNTYPLLSPPVTTEPEKTSIVSNSVTPLNIWVVTSAALVDAINPCAFAVLVILMGTMLMSGNRKRALVSGLTFTSAIYLSYLAMGLGLYSAIASTGITLWIERIVGILAILLGLFNLKDTIWYGKGFLMEVPLSWRPRLKKLIQSVTNPLTAFGVGILVSLFLLPCTSGPYLIIIGMLGVSTTLTTAVKWLVYYNIIFILPMIIITLAVYMGLKPECLEAIRQRRLRLLHAIAGIILLALGLYLLI